jgi:F-type H+-transporting ATPase subunit delta
MFHAERWAGVFLTVSGANADEAFLCLKALAENVKTLRGLLFGHSASAKLEKILRECVTASAVANTAAAEYAIRLLCLLVEKNCFRYVDLLLQKIEQDLDAQNGILDVTVETTSAVNGGFEKEFERLIKDKTGAAGVKIKTTVRPELLGGYILRIGSFYIDASLKGQLESMAVQLSAPNLGTPNLGENTGGRNV